MDFRLISDWHDRNLKTSAEIENYMQTMKKQTKNIKELAKQTNYNNYEQRHYDNFDNLYSNNNT